MLLANNFVPHTKQAEINIFRALLAGSWQQLDKKSWVQILAVFLPRCRLCLKKFVFSLLRWNEPSFFEPEPSPSFVSRALTVLKPNSSLTTWKVSFSQRDNLRIKAHLKYLRLSFWHVRINFLHKCQILALESKFKPKEKVFSSPQKLACARFSRILTPGLGLRARA